MICDELIIGGGLAGMMAAREALAKKLKTVLVRDGYGASPWVHGFNHPVRLEDGPKVFLDDVLKSGQGQCDKKLARALCEDSGTVFDSLQSLGLTFNRNEDGQYQAIRPLGASWPRVVSIGNETGSAILKRLEEILSDDLITIAPARAIRLIRDDHAVTGALVYRADTGSFLSVQAKSVVMAGGGFCGIYPISTNKHDSGGDACAMAYDAGALLTDMEFIQFEPSASVWPPSLNGTSMITTLFYEGAKLLNGKGERFMTRYGHEAERVGKDVLACRIAEEIASGRGTPHGGVYMDLTGVDPAALERDYPMYLERYARVGIDLKKDRIELAPAPHTSLGGIRADEFGRASLPGLFACGECLGGLHGANRLGGNGGLEALVFGRRAGISAADYAMSAPPPKEQEMSLPAGGPSIAERLSLIRSTMGQALWQSAHVIRDGLTLKKGLGILNILLQEAESLQGADAQEAFALQRLKNDLTCARLLLLSALERDETVGCHIRRDCPGRTDAPYRILLGKKGTETGIERMEL